jgi:hypothetical protein
MVEASMRRRFINVNPAEDDGPQKSAYVLFAVLPPKNSDSIGAEAFSAQGFAIA